MGKRVAIIGSGCSGLGALWALKSTDHEVHLFEASTRIGGHTNTVTYEGPRGATTRVDTGFIVMNSATYPNFIAFLENLGIQPVKTDMTFGISRDQGKFEWAGTSLSSVFAQRRNILNPRMWRLIFDIIRFNEFALDVLRKEEQVRGNPIQPQQSLKTPKRKTESVGEYLDRECYSQTFRDDYLIPMTAAVWSTTPDKCSLHFPIITLVRFMWNHHLLSTIGHRPDWMTIPGGSQRYIDAVLTNFPKERIRVNCEVTALTPSKNGDGVVVATHEKNDTFDHVILATHGDQALDILLPVATKEEIDILSGFQTSRNIAVLHSDLSLMPQRRVAWSSWNYITESPFPPSRTTNVSKVCLTYWMNLLQHISEDVFGPVLVTLNPLTPPDPRLIQGIWEYSHPLYNADSINSQALLPKIQNTRRISYCGAWTKYGFHEDGFSSGISVAMEHLGAKLPFKFVDSTFSRGKKPELRWRNQVLRVTLLAIHILIIAMEVLLANLLNFADRLVATRRKLE